MKQHAAVSLRAAIVTAIGIAVLASSAAAPAADDAGKQGENQAPAKRNPYSGNAAAAMEGRRLFMANNCYGCHSPGGGGAMGPALIDAKWEHGSKPGDLYKSVAEGHPDHGMPPFGKRLGRDEIWKLVTFLQSIGKTER